MGIREVARIASVSTATVSRLITGTGRVSPHTAARVLDAMQALNFQPNEAARILAFQKKLKRSANVSEHTRSSIVGRSFPK
jgi:DNA-binding LacI/PurR family transcriptional regulator